MPFRAGLCFMPPALSLLVVLFPPELRPKAAGIWSAVAGLGLALGPVVGGVLVDVAGWRWVFLVNVPFVLLAAFFGLRWLPESRRPGVPPLDLPGVALSTLALRGIVFALIEGVDAGWTTPAVLVAAVTGIGAGVAFVATELRRREPLFDVRVLVRPPVAAGALVILAAYIAMLGMLFLLPQYVRYVQEGSALASGLEVAPLGLGLGCLAALSGRLAARHEPRGVLLAGLLTATVGFVPLLLLSADSTPALVLLGTGIVGCGLGAAFPPATAVIMNDLGTEKAGDGAAVNQVARQVGGALGVAIVGSVFGAIYAAEIADDGRVPAAAAESIEEATDVANRLHGAARADSWTPPSRASTWRPAGALPSVWRSSSSRRPARPSACHGCRRPKSSPGRTLRASRQQRGEERTLEVRRGTGRPPWCGHLMAEAVSS